jgi:hypothetical protein
MKKCLPIHSLQAKNWDGIIYKKPNMLHKIDLDLGSF